MTTTFPKILDLEERLAYITLLFNKFGPLVPITLNGTSASSLVKRDPFSGVYHVSQSDLKTWFCIRYPHEKIGLPTTGSKIVAVRSEVDLYQTDVFGLKDGVEPIVPPTIVNKDGSRTYLYAKRPGSQVAPSRANIVQGIVELPSSSNAKPNDNGPHWLVKPEAVAVLPFLS